MRLHLTPASRNCHPVVIAVVSGVVLGLGMLVAPPAAAQVPSLGPGQCVEAPGYPCSGPTGGGGTTGGGSRRLATAYNERGVALLRQGKRNRSLATIRHAIAYFRRAAALAPNSIAKQNHYTALANYWSLKAVQTSNCRDQVRYYRNAMGYIRYFSARNQQHYRNVFARLQRRCGSQQQATTGGNSGTGVRGRRVVIGAVAAVSGNVQLCLKGRCSRASSGKSFYSYGTVKTGRNSRVQLLFNDETVMTIGPNTEIVIDKYIYNPFNKKGGLSARINKGTFRFVSGRSVNKRDSLRLVCVCGGRKQCSVPGPSHLMKGCGGGSAIGIRGTDFVVRLSRAARTLVIELFDGALALKLKGKRRATALGLGIWTIKWSGRNGGPPYRASRHMVPAWGKTAALKRRRAYYNRVLPAKAAGRGKSSGAGSGNKNTPRLIATYQKTIDAIHRAISNTTKLIAIYTQALRRNPGDTNTRNKRSVAYRSLARYRKSLANVVRQCPECRFHSGAGANTVRIVGHWCIPGTRKRIYITNHKVRIRGPKGSMSAMIIKRSANGSQIALTLKNNAMQPPQIRMIVMVAGAGTRMTVKIEENGRVKKVPGPPFTRCQ